MSLKDTVSTLLTTTVSTVFPFTTNVTVSPTAIPGAFNLNAPESSSVEVTNVVPFFLI